MKDKLVFATNNQHKLVEVRQILGNSYDILSLKDINCEEDIPETGSTLEENALIKARYVKNNYGYDCFADDTGLEVYALDNAPGIYSARYAGEAKDPKDNMRKLLRELKGKSSRDCHFKTVIALIQGEKEYCFDGIIEGQIIEEERGGEGFGYDPIFVPKGYNETFAELGNDIKNNISHRAEAVKNLKTFLDENI
ncbi:XTP/dITP diphosphohydrolase [Dysgonomonadaceae bacterium PH5-43]|nr:XTP/dITP diphosphohydrolase [Dysgonomonadaceae bacterium PH5-43]